MSNCYCNLHVQVAWIFSSFYFNFDCSCDLTPWEVVSTWRPLFGVTILSYTVGDLLVFEQSNKTVTAFTGFTWSIWDTLPNTLLPTRWFVGTVFFLFFFLFILFLFLFLLLCIIFFYCFLYFMLYDVYNYRFRTVWAPFDLSMLSVKSPWEKWF